MKIVGVIAECNPLHNGHEKLLCHVRESLLADYVVVLMSGSFVQRGEPAVMDKHQRCRAVLHAGADLVLALPAVYTLAPAEIFARGAVITLNACGIIDELCFGSESGDPAVLRLLADIPDCASFSPALEKGMKSGQSYPAAFMQAMEACAPTDIPVRKILTDAPNNLLGIEYLRSLSATDSRIIPSTLLRSPRSDRITSASHLRELLPDKKTERSALSPFLPEASLNEIDLVLSDPAFRFVRADDLTDILKFMLLKAGPDDLAAFGDIGRDLAARIHAHRLDCDSFTSFADLLKVKAFTHARIRRALCQLILEIRQQDRTAMLESRTTLLRVLGFKENARPLLTLLADRAEAPLIVRGRDYHASFTPLAQTLLDLDLLADGLYESLCKTEAPRREEEEKMVVVV
ncbi:MAG: nucleotidyltransferase family protein [Lachnospiraceae bacterium]|nr:nucleotidyltransferase family protein [Lachnospiraceae bacterium]